MCGRYTLVQWEELCTRFGIPLTEPLTPRYNIAPTQHVPVIVREAERCLLKLFRWGLVPFWAKDPAMGNKLINARSETVWEKNSFRESLKNRRCLVPADGFYEWEKGNSGKKPYRFTLKNGELFSFAGLWDEWRSPAGENLLTFTIITTQANSLVSPIHSRMPVILDREGELAWLNPTAGREQLQQLLVPYASGKMECCEVSKLVNSPKNDHARVLLVDAL